MHKYKVRPLHINLKWWQKVLKFFRIKKYNKDFEILLSAEYKENDIVITGYNYQELKIIEKLN